MPSSPSPPRLLKGSSEQKPKYATLAYPTKYRSHPDCPNGLMPSYAAQLSVQERWGVVAYVEALQLSRNARVAALPEDVRAELEREAR